MSGINKKFVLTSLITISLLFAISFFISSQINTNTNENEFDSLTLEEKFSILSQQRTNSCGGGKDYVNSLSEDGTLIQGSCCSPMNFHGYSEQVENLKKYSEYEIIPKDPYNVLSEWAREMMEYDENTQLSSEHQTIYDNAMQLSSEGGPCCCMCWHWFAYSGLAKHLIINEDFTEEQIAELWELSDACGGEHHHGHGEGEYL